MAPHPKGQDFDLKSQSNCHLDLLHKSITTVQLHLFFEQDHPQHLSNNLKGAPPTPEPEPLSENRYQLPPKQDCEHAGHKVGPHGED